MLQTIKVRLVPEVDDTRGVTLLIDPLPWRLGAEDLLTPSTLWFLRHLGYVGSSRPNDPKTSARSLERVGLGSVVYSGMSVRSGSRIAARILTCTPSLSQLLAKVPLPGRPFRAEDVLVAVWLSGDDATSGPGAGELVASLPLHC